MDLKDYRIDLLRFVPAFSHHVLERNRMKRLTCADCEEAKKFKWIQLQNYVNYCKNKHMPLNGLAEREFEISLDGQSHKVKAMAVFTVHNVAPEETGLYHLDFTVGGQTVEIVQLDKTFYSRERARLQAEFAFISGDVEAYARRRNKSWIILGY
jgi:hypothetical protein